MSEANTLARDSLIGTHIDGRYTVHRELGRGGMGVVYEGVHDELGRAVAIKVLNTAWASDPTAVARFLREARTASSFAHGNIVDVSDLGRLPDGRPYLVMAKIAGIDLAALLASSGVQPAKRVAELLTGVAAALDLIHAKGFVHRDIKPENLMYVVREDGSETVMLLDFGIAAAVMSNEPRLTGQGAVFGTPQFMPPEVCSGGMPDARGDVYALATVAFELMSGHLPFGDDNMMRVLTAKLTSDPPTLSEVTGTSFPPALERVIARGLARDPDLRYPSASEFVAALNAATEDAPVSWRSGVLRPSLRSAALPVGNHSYTGPTPTVPPEEHVRSERPRTAPPGSTSSRPEADPSHTPYPPAPRAETRHPSDAGQERAASGRSHRPRSQPSQPWAGAYEDDIALGAGLRASERRRTMHIPRSRRGTGVVLALLAAGVVGGVLWLRRSPDLGLVPGANQLGEAVDSIRPTPQPRRPAAASASPAPPAGGSPPSAAATPSMPAASARDTATPPPAATDPVAPAAAATPETEIAAADPTPASEPASRLAAPAPSAESEPGVPEPATTPVAAATPKAVAPATPSTPVAPVTPKAPITARAPATPTPMVPLDPPAPSSVTSVAPEPILEPDSPVLVVQEAAPPAPDPDAELDLPVRPPAEQATQLARDATTALLAGEVSHAIELSRQATRSDPGHALAWRTLGLALERAGDRAAALRAYEEYIRLAPHGPQSDMVRDRMRALEP